MLLFWTHSGRSCLSANGQTPRYAFAPNMPLQVSDVRCMWGRKFEKSAARLEMEARHRRIVDEVDGCAPSTKINASTPAQDVYPGLFDTVISGVCHFGEEYEETAVRELSEEMGLPSGCLVARDLQQKVVFRWKDTSCDVWGCAFLWRLPAGVELRLQEEEVTAAEFVPLASVCEPLPCTVAPVKFGKPLLNNVLACAHVQVQK